MESTIIDVAKLSGYSTATVSRAFIAPDKVKEKTKKRIYAAAKELNYTPNAIARAMVRKKTDNIAFVIYEQQYPVVLNPFYARVFEGILQEVTSNGYSMFISSDKDLRLPSGEMYMKKQMDGVIIGGKTDMEILLYFKKQNIPVVLLNNYLDYENVTCIVSDEKTGAHQAMEHIIAMGHKKIGLIAGKFVSHIYNPRYDAYVKVLTDNNISVDNRFVQTIEPTRSAAYECIKKMLTIHDRPSAFFCTNDTIAVGALKAVLHSGLKVPEDIAIIGYDNSDICTICEPELSSIHVKKEEMGRLAAKELIRQIEGGDRKKQCIVTETKLIVRNSTKKISNF